MALGWVEHHGTDGLGCTGYIGWALAGFHWLGYIGLHWHGMWHDCHVAGLSCGMACGWALMGWDALDALTGH